MAHGAASRRRVCIHRQGELKNGTVGYACRGPQPATVGFNDRTADRESHAHAAGFGGEEGVEQPVRILGGNPDAAIRHTYEHLLCLVLTRLFMTATAITRADVGAPNWSATILSFFLATASLAMVSMKFELVLA
jgi:hypothetical protein